MTSKAVLADPMTATDCCKKISSSQHHSLDLKRRAHFYTFLFKKGTILEILRMHADTLIFALFIAKLRDIRESTTNTGRLNELFSVDNSLAKRRVKLDSPILRIRVLRGGFNGAPRPNVHVEGGGESIALSSEVIAMEIFRSLLRVSCDRLQSKRAQRLTESEYCLVKGASDSEIEWTHEDKESLRSSSAHGNAYYHIARSNCHLRPQPCRWRGM